MNISAGAPHILLFERDQQLVGLLSSELQLAGFECHTARTAVEVFDAIARYPIRMVLVNLAQAATARREFWVALDTQRRGRGIQVFTFHCTNLAGYGPAIDDDEEERSHAVVADMEVDGMMGVMNMVNGVRSRMTAANTGVMPRVGGAPGSAPGSQVKAPIPSLPASNADQAIRGTVPTHPSLATAEASRPTSGNYTDKILAVIYPHQRSWNPATGRDTGPGSGQYVPAREQQQPIPETLWAARSPQNSGTPVPLQVETASNGQARRLLSDTGLPKESSLAQLSRMLQEHRSSDLDEFTQRGSAESDDTRGPLQEDTALHQRVHSAHEMPIGSIPLRASPIQDMPVERSAGSRGDIASQANPNWHAESAMAQYAQVPPSPPLASLGMPAADSFQAPAPVEEEQNLFSAPVEPAPVEREREEHYRDAAVEEEGNRYSEPSNHGQLEQQATMALPATPRAPDNALLLDIMQSLPPMSSPPPQSSQPQAHNGRATRSLGSVLLEGHLVPQSRLEVAQSIQRMLSGVDMNYQLGEILLMFKLLTPDQLLAASLVSYGLITTTQIGALGRIRQELHSIGLEYDLESLVILFRILTSEQLREVRTAWSG